MTDTKQNTRISQFRFGQPKESLKLEHVTLGTLDKDKVRVRVEATNINPSDLLSIYGVGQYKHSHQPPRVPGFEAVGRVAESSIAEFSVNQRVLVATSGTWQNYIDVSPDDLFQIPQHLESGYACQLYINALTAWVLTTEVTKLSQEDVLIINAGSSAIGKIFSQLSESLGFKIIVVTSQPERTQTTSCHVLDAKSDLVAQIQRLGLPQPTVAFDAIGGSPGTDLVHTLSNNGRFINYGTLSLDFYEPRFFEHAKSQGIDFSTFFLRYWEEAEGKGVRRDKFTSMLDHFITNDIQLDVDRYLPFDEVQTAIDLIESKTTRLDGKIILLPV
ncbi:zinc-dependent alcohol dehydrogenase family protein [Vibrio lentus]|uniref:Alcohol dehydrogenase n=1 Tax=Vibrio lentus TaxID=136468 RepID=A0A855IXB8_9VIBR|nr:zinc-dependent alcohol dehydrogenase family protein [Vibrio lentus]PMJ60111.1 alcohol dehydrogenase [Vibrio lentus]PMJ90717.1 alcohol dehydrogenase [Vibrio lentus]PMM52613.1 alcohol dehydrogenase [Vibrio lentus]PMM63234.1 alcohol dehydrogenase [Vibrio lentus]PMN39559.1 alcohol dehydrogenase [Vibrio lentus]